MASENDREAIWKKVAKSGVEADGGPSCQLTFATQPPIDLCTNAEEGKDPGPI